jgi:hypothetical protein
VQNYALDCYGAMACARTAPSKISSPSYAAAEVPVSTTDKIKNPRLLAGECLCGAVQYQVADAFAYALNCHCSNCRRATGAAFKPFAGIQRELFRVVAGDELLGIFGDTQAHNAHCQRCGSLLYSVVREGAFVHVTLGTLLDAPTIRPSAHIFVASKAPWFDITDALPQYKAFE